MTPEQIQHVRDNHRIAAVITTRNATYWIVDQDGREGGTPGSDARYELVEWDDVNGLCVLRSKNQIRTDQFGTLMHLNYDIIDELISIEEV